MILILGGTTEGRMAVQTADEAGTPYFYSTRGSRQEIVCKHGTRLTGGMDVDGMLAFCRKHEIGLLVDAAHPFAEELHRTVAAVAAALHLPVVRLERRYPPHTDAVCWCDGYADAIARLEMAGVRRLLALTGVQTIGRLRPFWEKRACWFRVLRREESVGLACSQGFDPASLCFYDMPLASLMDTLQPDAILTKESGESGGFGEKVTAAVERGIPVFAVKRPPLPACFIPVTGEHGLRKQIEKYLPAFFPLRSGYTTGSCATAAAKAALLALLSGEEQATVSFALPDGEEMILPVLHTETGKESATASVVKDAGDDPDVTHGSAIVATVAFSPAPGIHFLQGEGVGTVTLPGLGIAVGEPAINPTPRALIARELSALYGGGLDVTISVPGGRELALRTFNPKLGIVGGISIIGTSGIVRPFSSDAFVEAIRREVEVCVAIGAPRLVINSGAKSERYVKSRYPELPPQAFVQYGNFIGETLQVAAELQVAAVTMGIMLGKAVKLAEGSLDTHSKRGVMNKEFLQAVALSAGCSPAASGVIDGITLARELWTLLSPADAALFFPQLLAGCLLHCAPLLPAGVLSILLIDEEGRIAFSV